MMEYETDPVLTTVDSYNATYEHFINQTIDLSNLPELSKELSIFVDLVEGKNVLDVGFGSGRDTCFFLEKGLKVLSIDISLKFAKHLQSKNLSQICLMDMRRLGLKNNYFNGLWACASALHIPRADFSSTLREFYSVLSERGLLYLSMKEGQGEEWSETGLNGLKRYYVYYTKDEINNILTSEGFEIVQEFVKGQNSSHRRWISIFARKI